MSGLVGIWPLATIPLGEEFFILSVNKDGVFHLSYTCKKVEYSAGAQLLSVFVYIF